VTNMSYREHVERVINMFKEAKGTIAVSQAMGESLALEQAFSIDITDISSDISESNAVSTFFSFMKYIRVQLKDQLSEAQRSIYNAMVEEVASIQGCKATELFCCSRVSELYVEHSGAEDTDPDSLLELAVFCEDIISIEYSVPNIPHKVKQFLLPKGTIIYE